TKNNIDESKLTAEAKDLYSKNRDKAIEVSNQAKTKNNELKNFIKNDLKPLVDGADNYLKDLIAKQNELNDTIKAYNKYVELINKGLASADDKEFIFLKKQIDTLMEDSQDLADLINNNQDILNTWKKTSSEKYGENFKINGAFTNVILNTNPNLDEITGGGGEIEIPDKPIDPAE
ncbi:hypothetical protein, partial [Campylobacter sp. CNRCH_2014_0184h]|uniref:hypothetical protein n=1 Tax=Campylobacter sp. CNRCH_2014_0184h TaxID=2911602 RepID=UPI0021E6A2EB